MENQNDQNLLSYFEKIASGGLNLISGDFEKYVCSTLGVKNPKQDLEKGLIQWLPVLDQKNK